MKEELLGNQLKCFYDRILHFVNKGHYEFIIDEIFDIADIISEINNIMEDHCRDHFILKKDEVERVRLLTYDDYLDFLNTITKIDVNDLCIYFSEEDLQRYTISIIVLLNDAFNKWVQNSKLFRKKSKIYMDIVASDDVKKSKNKEIVIFFDPEVKF